MCRSHRCTSLQNSVWTATQMTPVVLSECPLLQKLPTYHKKPQANAASLRTKQNDPTLRKWGTTLIHYCYTTFSHYLTIFCHVLLGDICQFECTLFKARNVPFFLSAKLKIQLQFWSNKILDLKELTCLGETFLPFSSALKDIRPSNTVTFTEKPSVGWTQQMLVRETTLWLWE